MADNSVTMIGNVTRDPQIKFFDSGAAVTEFGIAVNKRRKNKQTGEWEDEPHFFDVKCWSSLAQNVIQSVQKGCRVVVTGELTQRTWEDRDSGSKRSRVEVNAEEVAPSLRWATAAVSRNPKNDGGGYGGQQQQQPQQGFGGQQQQQGGFGGPQPGPGGQQGAPAQGFGGGQGYSEEPF